MELFTVGVEEEYQIIDPETRSLCPRSHHILPIAQEITQEKSKEKSDGALIQLEFRQCQIEAATPICSSLDEVRAHLTRQRYALITAAEREGCFLAAAGTHPFSSWQEQMVTPNPAYINLVRHYQGLMRELVTFGCHVHVGVGDRKMAIQIMNRARLWLAPLLALSTSSPFWAGQDTLYASYRTMLIRRLPMTGPPHSFASLGEYQSVVGAMLETQMIHQVTQVCWDLRPSERFPTLEFRIPDMPLTLDEAVLIAGLVRGLVRICYEHIQNHVPYPAVRQEVLEAAQWSAARWGLEADLVDVAAQRRIPAHALIEQLLTFVRPALEDFGEWDEVSAIAQQVMAQGTGATRQRHQYEQRGSLIDVVDYLVAETLKGLPLTAMRVQERTPAQVEQRAT